MYRIDNGKVVCYIFSNYSIKCKKHYMIHFRSQIKCECRVELNLISITFKIIRVPRSSIG